MLCRPLLENLRSEKCQEWQVMSYSLNVMSFEGVPPKSKLSTDIYFCKVDVGEQEAPSVKISSHFSTIYGR